MVSGGAFNEGEGLLVVDSATPDGVDPSTHRPHVQVVGAGEKLSVR